MWGDKTIFESDIIKETNKYRFISWEFPLNDKGKNKINFIFFNQNKNKILKLDFVKNNDEILMVR